MYGVMVFVYLAERLLPQGIVFSVMPAEAGIQW